MSLKEIYQTAFPALYCSSVTPLWYLLHNSKVMACLPGRWGCALLCGWGRFSVPGANYYIGKTGTVWHPKEPLVENNCWNQSIQNRGNLRFWLTGVSFKYYWTLYIWQKKWKSIIGPLEAIYFTVMMMCFAMMYSYVFDTEWKGTQIWKAL